jgi:hypothetical protein
MEQDQDVARGEQEGSERMKNEFTGEDILATRSASRHASTLGSEIYLGRPKPEPLTALSVQ